MSFSVNNKILAMRLNKTNFSKSALPIVIKFYCYVKNSGPIPFEKLQFNIYIYIYGSGMISKKAKINLDHH